MQPLRTYAPTVLGDLRSNRSFCRLLAGRLVTNAGDSLYYIAAMWLVYDLTGSPLYTGIAGFLVRAPSALSFLTGPLVDRWSLRRVLVGTQLINGLLVLTIPLAAWMNRLSVWVILAVLPLVTLVNQFVYPAQNAALPRMVPEDNLARANSLLSAAYQGADMVFNAASGVLIAIVGAVALFVVDSVTFGLALVLFAGITVPRSEDLAAESASTPARATDEETGSADAAPDESVVDRYLADLRVGIRYVRGSLLVILLGGVVVANFAVGALLGVLPAFAGTVGGPDAYGILMAAYAGGTLAGTIVASSLDEIPLGQFAIVSNVLTGAVLAIALAIGWFPATVGLFFLTFFPIGSFNVLFFTMLQSAVEDDLLGRVSSLVTSAASAAIPVGSAVGGAVAGAMGSRFVMYWWAVGTIFFGLYVALRGDLRRLPPAPEITAEMLQVGTAERTTIEDGDDGAPASAAGGDD